MKKTILMAMVAMLGGAASAAPGFVKAVFSGSAYNGTSDIWSYTKATVVEDLDEIYAVRSDFPETTTYAYGTYMQLEGGVEYYFGGTFDDYVSVKVDDVTVVPQGGSCGTVAYGVIKFAETGWHKVDLRVANNAGPGGNTANWYLGGIHMAKSGNGFSKIVNSEDGTRLVTEAPAGYEPAIPEYAFSFSTYSASSKTYVQLIKCGGCVSELSIPETVLGYPVGQINDSCFNGNTTLKTIAHWPSQLMTIGGSAFYGCTALTAVEVPDTVTSLGGSAFRCCSSLKTAKLPAGLKGTADALFMDCTSLESVTMPTAPTKIDNHTFRNCINLRNVSIPKSVGSIGAYAFCECHSLPAVTLPDQLCTIGEYAFYGCYILPAIDIPKTVVSIGSWAFAYCKSIKEFTFPNSISTMNSYLVRGCESLTDVTIPSSVTRMEQSIFEDCVSLEEIHIPETVTYIGPYMFQNCQKLRKVNVPSKVASVNSNLFAGCCSLEEITIPAGVTRIENEAFANCTMLAEIILPGEIAFVGNTAFRNCSRLKSIVIPESLVEFGYRVFQGCSGLQHVRFLGAPPARVGDSYLFNYHWCASRKYGAQWIALSWINNFYGYDSGSILTANVISSSIRENDPTIMDVIYKVTSKKPTVKIRVLAFEDGERSFAKVVRPETFVTDTNGVETACNVGDNVTPNVEHTISWRVSSDWTTKLAKVKFEVLAMEENLIPLELMTIPASDQYGKMKISWNAISSSQWFDALLWLYADKDAGLKLESGKLIALSNNGILVNGTTVMFDDGNTYIGYPEYRYELCRSAAFYVYGKMGYSLLTGAPLTYANSETRLGLSPSGARQYAYKIVEE